MTPRAQMENNHGRVVDVPDDAVVVCGYVFPPGTDIRRDVLAKVKAPNGRPVLPIGRVVE